MTLRILLVDDSKVSRLALSKALRKIDETLDISEAASADAAEQYLETTTVDCVLIDYNMPDRNGLELAEALFLSHPAIKKTLVTANIQDTLRERALSMGVGFIAKPAKPEELAAVLGA
ncbi:response regulator [Marinomonas pollencensis]|uniref:Response regulator receiver domain-containing protein n=1 Tax=Marinomonas pollencensis TaxID=491954 RepID=A0A3E0DN71_9GAMM|nr:response regulator [Marinomonas pollencensis]REG83251.1 response regulator receiver domain-containing protein [Marinomonas pollencensis]